MTKNDILKIINEKNIKVIRLIFTDILGIPKSVGINVKDLDNALIDGVQFDGSSIEGFVRIEESDLILMPDINSFKVFPFNPAGVASGMFICDVYKADGSPLESDPRQILRRMIEKSKKMGFDHFYVGPELEFFYFPQNMQTTPLDNAGYFDILPLDESTEARAEAMIKLTEMGMRLEADHHEVAPSQHEIDYRYGDAIMMADQMIISKMVIKEVARRHNLFATFMPKPITTVNGSGMHVHQSLFTNNKNTFYDKNDPYELSETAKYYLAGLLKHAEEITILTNPTINSYKRIVPGYEAPAYICWGRKNRTTLVRVPAFKHHNPNACRLEYRAPDPSASPYLAFASMLGAGLTGIENKYELENPMEQNIFTMTDSEKQQYNIRSLPEDLREAIRVSKKSELIKNILGENLHKKYLANKCIEWEKYRLWVSDFEIREYLAKL